MHPSVIQITLRKTPWPAFAAALQPDPDPAPDPPEFGPKSINLLERYRSAVFRTLNLGLI